MKDLIKRQKAIDALDKHLRTTDVPISYPGIISALSEWLNELPSAQPEPSIPISWIEKQIDWLKNTGNKFSVITAMNISVLVKKWRKENGKDDGSD